MQRVLKLFRQRLFDWISLNPMIATGGFLSGTFLFVGVIGTLALSPVLLDWHAAANWSSVDAEITASRLDYGGVNRGARPDFTFSYEWQGRSYTSNGYDLIGAYTRSTSGGPHAVLEAYPVGSRVKVLVNPDRPTQAVLIRGSIGGLIVSLVPPFFVVLGLTGAFFTVISGLGWLDSNTRNPLGLALRSGGRWFLREQIVKPLFFLVVGSVILGVAAMGVYEGDIALVLFGGVMAWGLWRASRPPNRRHR